jgi:peptide/nickel transport system substrate-binding protein
MVRNENYHQAEQGLPEFDVLVFRFVDGGEEALAAYHSGECQIVINEPGLINYQSELITDQQDGLLSVHRVAGSAWEQLSFGISTIGSSSNLFNSLDLRQVVSQCVDRKELVSSRLDAGGVVNDFYYPGDPRVGDQQSPDTYQPVDAGIKLRDLGWVDDDGDPLTPRIADDVNGVKDGTSLQVSLLAAGEGDVPLTVQLIGQGLRNCGFEVDTQLLPVKDLLEFGPDGPVFGRNFDLAYFSWAVGHYQLCRLFTTAEIPGLYPDHPKGWGGVNPTGYSNQEFDSFCRNAYTNLPDSDVNLQAHEQMSLLFREELPVLPLFFRVDLVVIDPELKGIQDGNYQLLWNIEEFR